jgi:hypothetical protein
MNAPASETKSGNSQQLVKREDRNTWIFTAYAICGIACFGVIAYYASMYFAH